jgi:hypothetical protein
MIATDSLELIIDGRRLGISPELLGKYNQPDLAIPVIQPRPNGTTTSERLSCGKGTREPT